MNRINKYAIGIVLICTALCLLPSSAYADAGLPMLALTLPAAVIALVPVILIEAYVFKRRGFPFWWALKWNTVANAASTIAGVPLTWGILVVLEMLAARALFASGIGFPSWDTWPGKALSVILQAPWLAPWENPSDAWIVPTAFLILLVPFFLVSWLLETLIIRGFNPSYDRKAISRACLRANLISYALLALYPISLFWR